MPNNTNIQLGALLAQLASLDNTGNPADPLNNLNLFRVAPTQGVFQRGAVVNNNSLVTVTDDRVLQQNIQGVGLTLPQVEGETKKDRILNLISYLSQNNVSAKDTDIILTKALLREDLNSTIEEDLSQKEVELIDARNTYRAQLTNEPVPDFQTGGNPFAHTFPQPDNTPTETIRFLENKSPIQEMIDNGSLIRSEGKTSAFTRRNNILFNMLRDNFDKVITSDDPIMTKVADLFQTTSVTTVDTPEQLERYLRPFLPRDRTSEKGLTGEELLRAIETSILSDGNTFTSTEMQSGGIINTTGFRDGAETANNLANIIPGANVSMDGVSQPIVAFPLGDFGIGAPTVLEPNGGDYIFAGSRGVLEIPLNEFRDGGMPSKNKRREMLVSSLNNNIETIGLKSEDMNELLPDKTRKVLQKFQLGGQVQPEVLGIQTELGEQLIYEDASIVDVNADKKHAQLDDDLITDYVPEGTFVASAYKGMRIDRDDAEEVLLGIDMKPYIEGKKGAVPIEITLASMFTKKRMTPAEVTERVRKKFSLSNKDHDVFTERTNEENKLSRLPYLQGIIGLSEFQRMEQEGVFRNGGSVKKKDTEEYQLGSIIGAGASFLGGLFSFIDGNNKATQNRNLLNQGAARQSSLLNQGALANALGVLGQDTAIQTPQLTDTFLNQQQTNIPRGLTDFAQSRSLNALRPLTESAFSNTTNFNQAINSITPAFGSQLTAASQAALSDFNSSINRQNSLLQLRNNLANQQEQLNTQTANQVRTNSNRNLVSLGGIGSDLATNQANLEGTRVTGLANVNNGLAANSANFISSLPSTAFLLTSGIQGLNQNNQAGVFNGVSDPIAGGTGFTPPSGGNAPGSIVTQNGIQYIVSTDGQLIRISN